MNISEIGISGFKSFGNNEQILKIKDDKGELILLCGRNGNGKSSILNAFEYTLYGKVRGRKRKYATLSTLPNRINGTLLNRIKFKSNGTEVEIKRGISPNILELWENGIENKRSGKTNIDEKIQDYIGIDLETFNSFISMSINDFKNFTSLSNEEKQLLLDKLFNLEIINILNDILKQIVKNNKSEIQKHETEISIISDSINSIKKSIEKHKERELSDNLSEIEKIKINIESKKDPYKLLKEKKDKIKEKEIQLKNLIDKEKENYYNTSNDLKNIEKNINLYNKGKCPTCETDFNNDYYNNLKDSLNIKKEDTEKIFNEISKNISNLNDKSRKLTTISKETDMLFNEMTIELRDMKNSLTKLNEKMKSDSEDNSSVEEFINSINELEEKSNISSEKLSTLSNNEIYYKEISKIFSENGVKKIIIQNIIKPLNLYLSENIKDMGLNFKVELDETFTAKITSLNSEIDHDTLSTGESKLININILIAYLKLIRTKKNINILFLDEVFSSIDLENISKILNLLKGFASKYKVNIFVVHHAVMNQEIFDRVIQVDKDVFTQINEIDINNI